MARANGRRILGLVEVKKTDAQVQQQGGRDGLVVIDADGLRVLNLRRGRLLEVRISISIGRISSRCGIVPGYLDFRADVLIDLERGNRGVPVVGEGWLKRV